MYELQYKRMGRKEEGEEGKRVLTINRGTLLD